MSESFIFELFCNLVKKLARTLFSFKIGPNMDAQKYFRDLDAQNMLLNTCLSIFGSNIEIAGDGWRGKGMNGLG